MTTFRQWHDEDGKFHDEKFLYFAQCGQDQKMSLSELLRLTSDSAVEDYRQKGISWNFLRERGLTILVSRQAFRFHKMPEANQGFTILTWEEQPQPLQLRRVYNIVDTETGALLVSGLSFWTVVDLSTRRIVRTKDFTLREPPQVLSEQDCMEPGKISAPEGMTLLAQRPILYSDIDGNGHTNNSRYGAFAIDCLPDEFRAKPLAGMKINYSKEAVLGEEVQLFGANDEASKKFTVIGKQQDGICFECELFY